MPLSINSIIVPNSLAFTPREVIGTEPILNPLGTNADLSLGTVFLFTDILTAYNIISVLAPSINFGFKFTSTR